MSLSLENASPVAGIFMFRWRPAFFTSQPGFQILGGPSKEIHHCHKRRTAHCQVGSAAGWYEGSGVSASPDLRRVIGL